MNGEPADGREIDVYYRETPDFTAAGTHFHNVHQIIFVRDGAVRIAVGDKNYAAVKNSFIFISNLENHSVYITAAPYKRYVVTLSRSFGSQLLQNSPLLSVLMQRPEHFSHMLIVSDDAASALKRVLDSMICETEQQKAFWVLRLSSMAVELLIGIYRYSSAAFPAKTMDETICIVSETQKYIIEHAHEDISLEQLAARHFISKYHLSRIFSRVTGYTFRNYLILHRLSIAKDLLLHTSKPVSEISNLCGYNNVNHFIRIFRTHESMPPHQFRKAHRGR